MMRGQIANVPGGGWANLCDLGANIDKDADIEISAADARRLRDAEEAQLVQITLGLVRQAPQPLAFRDAFSQARGQIARPPHHLVPLDPGKRCRSPR
jgi:hypothetical protein